MTDKEPIRENYANEDTMSLLLNSNMDDPLKTMLLEMYESIQALKLVVGKINPQKTITKSYLSSREVCAMLGISKRCLQNWRDQKKIPYQRLYGKIVYDRDVLLQWMK